MPNINIRPIKKYLYTLCKKVHNIVSLFFFINKDQLLELTVRYTYLAHLAQYDYNYIGDLIHFEARNTIMDELPTHGCDYNILKEDPLFLLPLLNKYVRVEVLKDIIYCGYLVSIDPLKHSAVLMVSHEGVKRKVLIPGHAILNITVQEPLPNVEPFKNPDIGTCTEDIKEKKQKTILWLQKNLLPVSESGENIVLGNASILPPYRDCDICTDNPIVAGQLRKIIMKMPKDFT